MGLNKSLRSFDSGLVCDRPFTIIGRKILYVASYAFSRKMGNTAISAYVFEFRCTGSPYFVLVVLLSHFVDKSGYDGGMARFDCRPFVCRQRRWEFERCPGSEIGEKV